MSYLADHTGCRGTKELLTYAIVRVLEIFIRTNARLVFLVCVGIIALGLNA